MPKIYHWKYTVQWCLVIFTKLCNYCHFLTQDIFIISERNPHWLAVNLISLLSHPLEFSSLYSFTMNFPILSFLESQWSHKYVALCVWIFSLSALFSGFTNGVCISTSFLWLSSIPFHWWNIIFHIPQCEILIYHIFKKSIHQSMDIWILFNLSAVKNTVSL